MMMKNCLLSIFLTIGFLTGFQSAKAANETLLLRTPSISKDHLVFVYAGDIWIAQRDGSYPVRLTVHQGWNLFHTCLPMDNGSLLRVFTMGTRMFSSFLLMEASREG